MLDSQIAMLGGLYATHANILQFLHQRQLWHTIKYLTIFKEDSTDIHTRFHQLQPTWCMVKRRAVTLWNDHFWYLKSILARQRSKSPLVFLHNPDFTNCTALSARPFAAGWYGDDVRWWILFWVINSLNSSLVKDVLLSEKISSRILWVAKRFRRTLMVAANEAEGTGTASTHLEWASMTTKIVLPSTGPVWSICMNLTPWLFGPFLGVQRCSCRRFLI